ncbi:MAG: carboxypeptidase regulatory-like domain-containing protein [Acidobacteria bacterium]|nr:carboxypeptidase regulatory-like domain-containing protein [Acidobacteriota bacterium]
MKHLAMIMLSWTAIATAQISGNLIDETDAPMQSALIYLTNSNGVETQTLTDQNGDYAFSGLADGSYLVSSQAPLGYGMDSPGCNYEIVTVSNGQASDVNFDAERRNGVIVEIGTPMGPGRMLSSSGATFTMTIFANNLQASGLIVDGLTIEGTWMIPGAGQLDTTAIQGVGEGVYAMTSLTADYTNYIDGSVSLEITNKSTPYILTNGAIATYTFYINAAEEGPVDLPFDRLAFCIDAVYVHADATPIEGYANSWIGMLSN